jgi:triacylglycerol esterase/lipase EstA (alpha/beta hydrolase family)
MNQLRNHEVIVLVHGLAAIRPVMWPIARRLRKRGFRVINYGYWSSFRKIEDHGTKLSRLLVELEKDPDVDKIHLVTHSMGCIICRWILCQQPFEKLGRWAMLAPPNCGSHAADFPGCYFTWLIVPLRQLSESANSFVNQLPDFRQFNDVEFAILEAAYDRVIRPSSLPLEGQHDYARFACHHGPMPINGEVIDYVEQFIGGQQE